MPSSTAVADQRVSREPQAPMEASLRRQLTGYAFIAPWLFALVFFIGYPFFSGLYFSFCDYPPLKGPQFIGMDNYRELAADAVFQRSMGVTLIYAAVSIPLGVILALTLAMLLNARIRGQTFYRVFYYLPHLIPGVVTALLWQWIYNPDFGLFNVALKHLMGWWDQATRCFFVLAISAPKGAEVTSTVQPMASLVMWVFAPVLVWLCTRRGEAALNRSPLWRPVLSVLAVVGTFLSLAAIFSSFALGLSPGGLATAWRDWGSHFFRFAADASPQGGLVPGAPLPSALLLLLPPLVLWRCAVKAPAAAGGRALGRDLASVLGIAGVALAGLALLNAGLTWLSPTDMHQWHSPAWLADANPMPAALPFAPSWALWGLIIMSFWGVGQMAVIYLAKLQDVPQDLYEAADIDGANWWHKTWHVTIPMVSPVILFNVVMAIIGTFQVFDAPYIMTNGGPQDKTRFVAMFMYEQAFLYQRVGYASAVAWVLFLIIVALTLLAFRLSQRHVFYQGR